MVKDFCVHLDKLEALPGEFVTGYVSLQTEHGERIEARGIRLSLHGQEGVEITRGSGDNETTHRAHRDIVKKRVTLLGFPKKSHEGLFDLEAGRKYTFPFKFHLPADCLPSCRYSHLKGISYLIESNIDRPWRIDNTCKTEVKVLPNSDVASAPPHYSHEVEEVLHPTACCCFNKGALKMSIEVDKVAFRWQEDLSVKAKVDNSACESPMQSLRVALSIASSYVAETYVDTHWHDVVVEEFPRAVEAHAPEIFLRHTFLGRDYQSDEKFPTSTVHGECITHQFVVRVIAEYWYASYSVELPVFVADGPLRSDSMHDLSDSEPTKTWYPDYPCTDSDHAFYDPEKERWRDGKPNGFYEKEEYGYDR